jgi:gamma-glutamylputrescine oxidase
MNLSFWEKESFLKNIDIAVVGSGIVGLTAAIHLQDKFPDKKITVFERGFLPSGASTKNAGFACFGSVSEILKDLSQFTENEVYALIAKRWKGLQKLRKLVGDNNLNYDNCGGYEVFSDEASFQKAIEFLPYLNRMLLPFFGENVYEVKDELIGTFGFENVKHLIFNKFEGMLDSGKMMQSLISIAKAQGIVILNGIEILAIEPAGIKVSLKLSENDYLTVNQVLVATNAFAKSLLPNVDLLPGRGQVIVTKPINNLKISGAFHIDSGYYYFRNIENRILIGGGRNIDFKAEETIEFGTTAAVQNELIRLLEEVILPNQSFEIDYGWSGIMAFGEVQAPIIQAVSNNIFCAIKCQGMGVALGALVGEEAAELF